MGAQPSSSRARRRIVVTLSLLLLAVLTSSIVPASAAQTSSADGSFKDTAVLISKVTPSGTNLIFDQANAGTITGTFSGKYVALVHLTLDLLTGNAVYQALDICKCTVDGKSGTLYFYEQGTITSTSLLSSTATIVKGTNHLFDLHGNIALQGIVYTPTGLTMGTYSGQIQWGGSDD